MLQAFRAAPPDDEPWTAEDQAAASVGRDELDADETVSIDDAMRRVE